MLVLFGAGLGILGAAYYDNHPYFAAYIGTTAAMFFTVGVFNTYGTLNGRRSLPHYYGASLVSIRAQRTGIALSCGCPGFVLSLEPGMYGPQVVGVFLCRVRERSWGEAFPAPKGYNHD